MMKRLIRNFLMCLSFILALSIAGAQPIKTWSWDDPVTYVNGDNIPGGDLTNRMLHCGVIQGGPYPATQVLDMQAAPSIEDMAFVVGGIPGTYYCVSTVDSIVGVTTSDFSNEVTFTVFAVDIGLVPNPPTNLQIQ